ncbi:ABC transporter permease [Actinoallomurus acaciae]|uniref:ABC transporter permease n=1 Tax=Actinoallomurus acaciae TaxID=502577 RepID=A0ABV5YMZ8_9ACTN
MTARVREAARPAADETAPPAARRRAVRLPGPAGAWSTAGLVVLAVVVWIAGSAASLWSEATLPEPGSVWTAFTAAVRTGRFWADCGSTVLEVGVAFAGGAVLGLVVGVVFWKAPIAGKIFEPYLVSFYAVPMVLFYPVMIVIVGINQWPVVILSTAMAFIPMALNTWVGLRGIRPVHLKLARSLGCGRRQTLLHIALPAAAPFLLAGLRLAGVYALIGAIAMEFTTASSGLGHRIRYLYESFDNATMVAYILVVFVISLALTSSLAVLERVLLKGRSGS